MDFSKEMPFATHSNPRECVCRVLATDLLAKFNRAATWNLALLPSLELFIFRQVGQRLYKAMDLVNGLVKLRGAIKPRSL